MLSRRNLVGSAVMTLFQVLVSAATLFVLYKFLLLHVGIEGLGVWALVLAAASIVRLSDLGLGASLVRFVSRRLAQGDRDGAARLVQTSAVVVGVLSGIVLACSYPVIAWGLGYFLNQSDLGSAVAVLPFALLALWVSIVAGIFQSGLDGCQQFGLRNGLDIGGNLIYFAAAVVLVPDRGLVGIGMAQLLQSIFLAALNAVALRRFLPIRWNAWHINREACLELWTYGLQLQGIALVAMLIEPTTKALLGQFGGLAMLGYYDMASRMLGQFRSLLVSVNLVLVPVIAKLEEVNPDQVESVYSISYRLCFYLSVPLYAGLFALLPIVSIAWIGNDEPIFVITSMILTVGMFLNSLVNPAYIVNLGVGNVRQNLQGFVVMSVMNALLGYVLGRGFGGYGVVVASALALAGGSWFILLAFHRARQLSTDALLPRESILLACVSIVGAAVSLFVFSRFAVTPVALTGLAVLVCVCAVGAAMWIHPVRRELVAWLLQVSTLTQSPPA